MKTPRVLSPNTVRLVLLVGAPLVGATAFLLATPPVRNYSCCSPCVLAAQPAAIASLPPLMDYYSNKDTNNGEIMSPEQVSDRLTGKRVALMFSAGWCPMCTSFEPSLMQFRLAAKENDKEFEVIYVPSDRSAEAAAARCAALDMLCVPFGEDADKLKRDFKIWAGSEALKFGFGGRRSGVPAMVVLNAKGDELAFLAAEAKGVKALQEWPLDDEEGIW